MKKVRIVKTGNYRYIVYNGKKYRIVSSESDDKIISKLNEIIEAIKKTSNYKKQKRKRKTTKKNIYDGKSPILTGSSETPKKKDVSTDAFIKTLLLTNPRLLLDDRKKETKDFEKEIEDLKKTNLYNNMLMLMNGKQEKGKEDNKMYVQEIDENLINELDELKRRNNDIIKEYNDGQIQRRAFEKMIKQNQEKQTNLKKKYKEKVEKYEEKLKAEKEKIEEKRKEIVKEIDKKVDKINAEKNALFSKLTGPKLEEFAKENNLRTQNKKGKETVAQYREYLKNELEARGFDTLYTFLNLDDPLIIEFTEKLNYKVIEPKDIQKLNNNEKKRILKEVFKIPGKLREKEYDDLLVENIRLKHDKYGIYEEEELLKTVDELQEDSFYDYKNDPDYYNRTEEEQKAYDSVMERINTQVQVIEKDESGFLGAVMGSLKENDRYAKRLRGKENKTHEGDEIQPAKIEEIEDDERSVMSQGKKITLNKRPIEKLDSPFKLTPIKKSNINEINEDLNDPRTKLVFDDGQPEGSNNNNQQGDGKNDGLFNDEINKMMKTIKNFKGTYALDQVQDIKINKSDPYFSFVMNTEPIKVPSGHWVSWFITPTTIEYYDSFGEDPNSESLEKVFKLTNQYRPNNKYQVKINRIKYQRNNTQNCGWFAMKFIKDRSTGKSFKDATGFKIIEDSLKGEKEIKKFKSKVEDFGYVEV